MPIETKKTEDSIETPEDSQLEVLTEELLHWVSKALKDDTKKPKLPYNDYIFPEDDPNKEKPALEPKIFPGVIMIADDATEPEKQKPTLTENQRELLLLEAREKKKPVPRDSPTINIPPVIPPVIPPRPNEAQRHIVKRLIAGTGKNSGPGLTGLVNTHTSCYLNSVVQCLSNTTSLLYYFLDKDFVRDINTNEGTCGYVARAFGNLIQKIWSGCHKAFVPKEMKSAVYQFAPRYKEGLHQDAHEFMITLTNWLHEDLRKDMVRARQVVWTPKERSFVQQTLGKTSIILETFCGQIKNSIICGACGKVKEKYEIFENLTLALPSNNSCSLEHCLARYFGKQPISGYRCPQCKSQSNIYQQAKIVSFPPVLVLQLNRFTENKSERGVTYQRNDIEVEFPAQLNHIFPKNYNLYATVNHRGTLEFGHYIAVGRNPVSERWYKYDDSCIREIGENMIQNPVDVYMLFYHADEEEQRAKTLFAVQ